jgi:molecular chaperone GrpE
VGTKQSVPPDHDSPSQPGRGAEGGPQGVTDTRASSAPASGAATDPAGAPTGDPEGQAPRDDPQSAFARYQRLAADFENYKRRTRQELGDRTQYANEELVRKLLPILDNLGRALEHAPEGVDRNWYEGIKMVARQFEDVLHAQGLSAIPAVGERFDPAQHEAIASEETDEHEEGTIVEEMQPGYRLHDRVLRPTLVKVAHPRALKS